MRLRDGAHAEVQPHHLRQKVANLELRQVKACAQHADECQRTRADLAAGHARRKWRTMGAPALGAHAAVQPVLLHLGLHRRNVEHLVAHRLAKHCHRAAAFAHRGRCAVMYCVHLSVGQQLAVRARVTLLRAALALAGSPLGALTAAGAIG